MFSNGTTPDSAVNYKTATALCMPDATLTVEANKTNLALPINAPGCTQRISMMWVSKVTLWLAFLIDGAGLTFQNGANCDDAELLLNAVNTLIAKHPISHDVTLTGDGTEEHPLSVVMPPTPVQGGIGTSVGKTIFQQVAGIYPPDHYGIIADDGTESVGTTTSAANLIAGTVPASSGGFGFQFPINTVGVPAPNGYGGSGIYSSWPGLTGTWLCIGWISLPGFGSWGYPYLIVWKRIA